LETGGGFDSDWCSRSMPKSMLPLPLGTWAEAVRGTRKLAAATRARSSAGILVDAGAPTGTAVGRGGPAWAGTVELTPVVTLGAGGTDAATATALAAVTLGAGGTDAATATALAAANGLPGDGFGGAATTSSSGTTGTVLFETGAPVMGAGAETGAGVAMGTAGAALTAHGLPGAALGTAASANDVAREKAEEAVKSPREVNTDTAELSMAYPCAAITITIPRPRIIQ
jgi:hypothetical protein